MNARRFLLFAALASLLGAATLNVLPWATIEFNAVDSTGATQTVRFAVDRGRLETLASTAPGTVLGAALGGITWTAAMQSAARDMIANLDLVGASLLWTSALLAIAYLARTVVEAGRAQVSGRVVGLAAILAGALFALGAVVGLTSAVLHVNDLNDALPTSAVPAPPATTTFGYAWNVAPFLAAVAALGLGGYAAATSAPGDLRYVLDRAEMAETGRPLAVRESAKMPAGKPGARGVLSGTEESEAAPPTSPGKPV